MLAALTLWTATAEAAPCPLPGQAPMLIARLYFGTRMGPGKSVTEQEWQSFLASTVTPRFPGGFTVFQATGQWRDPQTKMIARENSRVLEIATPDTEAARNGIETVSRLYREKFRQQSVGIVTRKDCASF